MQQNSVVNYAPALKKPQLKAVAAATLAALMAVLSQDLAMAEPALQPVSISAQCTTDSTGGDGRRHACDSERQIVTAPAGYVLAKETLSGGLAEGNGSEQECHVGWADQIDVIPGVPQPRTITLLAHARSPKGHWSGRGWAKCKFTVNMVPLPSR
jgi:hypothetical protein